MASWVSNLFSWFGSNSLSEEQPDDQVDQRTQGSQAVEAENVENTETNLKSTNTSEKTAAAIPDEAFELISEMNGQSQTETNVPAPVSDSSQAARPTNNATNVDSSSSKQLKTRAVSPKPRHEHALDAINETKQPDGQTDASGTANDDGSLVFVDAADADIDHIHTNSEDGHPCSCEKIHKSDNAELKERKKQDRSLHAHAPPPVPAPRQSRSNKSLQKEAESKREDHQMPAATAANHNHSHRHDDYDVPNRSPNSTANSSADSVPNEALVVFRNINIFANKNEFKTFATARNRAGPDSIDKIMWGPQFGKDFALLRFKTVEATNKILSHEDWLFNEEHHVYTSLLPPTNRRLFFIQNYPEDDQAESHRDVLELYLAKTAGGETDVKKLLFSSDNKSALVEFNKEVHNLSQKVKDKPHKTFTLTAHEISQPDAIQLTEKVRGSLGNLNTETIREALERHLDERRGSDKDNSIRYIIRKGKYAIVTFNDCTAVDLFDKTIVINNVELDVCPFYDFLGPLDFERAQMAHRLQYRCAYPAQLDRESIELLQSEEGQTLIDSLKERNHWQCQIEFHPTQHVMQIHGQTKDHAEAYAQEIINACLKTEQIQLDDQQLALTKSDEFLAHVLSLTAMQKFHFEVKQGKLEILALAPTAGSVRRLIEDYLHENTQYHFQLLSRKGYVQCFWITDAGKRIRWKYEAKSISFEHGTTELWVTAPSDMMQSIFKDIETFKMQIVCKTYVIKEPGLPTYFAKKGKQKITDISNQTHTCIMPVAEDNETADAAELEMEKVPKSSGTPKVLFDSIVKDAVRVKVVQGDITMLTVDGIVNAANKELKHGGGLAGAITVVSRK